MGVLSRLRTLRHLPGDDRADLGRALVALPLAGAAVWLLGYKRARRVFMRQPGRADPTAPRSPYRVAYLTRLAARRLPYQPRCLPESLVLWWLLRRHGHAPEVRIGVQRTDRFAAHAWVELDGEALNDGPDVASRYAAFPERAPLAP